MSFPKLDFRSKSLWFHVLVFTVMASAAAATSWFACDAVRIATRIRNESLFYKFFAAIIFGMCVIHAAVTCFWLSSTAKLRRKCEAHETEMDELTRSTTHALATPLSCLRNDMALALEGRKDAKSVLSEGIPVLDSLIDLVAVRAEIGRNRHRKSCAAPVEFDICAAISMQTPRYEASAKARGLEISFDICDEPILVMGNPSKVKMLVDNLAVNAIKYNQPGGKVHIAAGPVKEKNRTFFEITVSDTGIGMSEEEQQHMYDEFFRGKKAAKEEGFGEGLALVKSIAVFYGAQIDCMSAQGEGTVFNVRIPISQS